MVDSSYYPTTLDLVLSSFFNVKLGYLFFVEFGEIEELNDEFDTVRYFRLYFGLVVPTEGIVSLGRFDYYDVS